MKLVIAFNNNDRVIDIDVSTDMTVADLKAYVEAEGGGSSSDLIFIYNSKPMDQDSMALSHWNIQENDMIMVLDAKNTSQTSHSEAESRINNDIETTRQHLLQNPELQNNIKSQHPKLIEAIHDSAKFRNIMLSIEKERANNEQARRNELRNLQENPDNEESQRKILELIRQEAVMENFNAAMEHSPEVFANVTMLFVNVSVNNVPIKAFVDSGAQRTFLSKECVEKCNLSHLVDTRVQGIAKGVGTAKLLGRIHSAPIKVGQSFLPCSFTVMEESSIDLLLGLDMLRRHQASIDLKRNVLVFGDSEVPFLPESEIPSDFLQFMGQSPEGVDPAASSSIGASSSTTNAKPIVQNTIKQASEASHSDSSIQTLMNLGFSRQECINALNQTGGNAELAAAILFQ